MVLFTGFLSGTGTLQKNVDSCFKTLFNSLINSLVSLKNSLIKGKMQNRIDDQGREGHLQWIRIIQTFQILIPKILSMPFSVTPD